MQLIINTSELTDNFSIAFVYGNFEKRGDMTDI